MKTLIPGLAWRVVLAMLVLPVMASGQAGSVDTDPAEETGTLSVLAAGFENDSGQAGVSLFKSQEDMFAKPYRQAFAVITDGKAEIRLTGLPFGEYALVVFHDENKNGSVDHNIFRFPKEALGFPNGYRFGLKQGTPTFEKLRIIFDNRTPPLVIRLE